MFSEQLSRVVTPYHSSPNVTSQMSRSCLVRIFTVTVLQEIQEEKSDVL